jgi:LacI family transcriptional regulator
VIPDLNNPLFPPIVRGIEDVLSAAGYSALIVNTDNDPDRETAQVATLRSRQVEGMIFATALRHHPLLEQLAAEGFATVLVNRRVESAAILNVTCDDASGVAAAVRHLAELGHRRIAHLAGPQSTSTGAVRLRAYRQAMADAGLGVDDTLIARCDYWTEDEGTMAVRRLLDDDAATFTAILAGNDLLALGAYDALGERGLVCPDDVSVVGFNDIRFMDKLRPPLTSVRIPHYEIGAEAARVLLERLANPSLPAKSVLLPPALVVRQSTSPPPAA